MAPFRSTDDEFRAAVADPTVRTVADLCRRLGIVPRGANYEGVRRRADRLGISLEHLRRRRPSETLTDEEVAAAVATTTSIAGTLRELGFSPDHGAARQHVRRVIERMELDTSHHTGAGWARRLSFPERRLRPEDLADGRPRTGQRILQCLVEHGVRVRRCERCHRTRWDEHPIPLEVDHIDGDRWNNDLGNLRLLCPNCHALTPTYRGRNIGRRAGQPPRGEQ